MKVAIPHCSKGIGKIQERGASINPQVTKEFVFSLKTTSMTGTEYSCVGKKFLMVEGMFIYLFDYFSLFFNFCLSNQNSGFDFSCLS